MTQILVSNPTGYPRRETVVFGCPLNVTDEGQLLKVVPGGQIRSATIEVAPHASGYQDIVEVEPLKVEGEFRVRQMLFYEDGVGFPFQHSETLAESDALSVKLYTAVSPGGVGMMIIYRAPGEPWLKYQMLATVVSLDAKECKRDFGYSIDSGLGGVTYDRLRGRDTKDWISVQSAEGDPDGLLRDGQGVVSEGVHIQAGLVAEADDPALLSTAVALTVWDLTVAGDWRQAWGPWNTVPKGVHLDRKTSFGMRDHLGIILDKAAGRTGDQFGFGYWKHLDIISQGNGRLLDHDRWAVGREVCRRIWWLEADGSFPSKSDHPRFLSWSELPHWHKGVSPDQFRRVYHDGSFYDGSWTTMDEEHYAAAPLKGDFLLRGSFLSYITLRQKAFLMKTQKRWPGIGRALGRLGISAWDTYMATGDKELLADMKARFLPAIKTNFDDINPGAIAAAVADPSKAFDHPVAVRLIYDDPHTGIIGAGWYVWEDSIAVGALDKLAELFADPELVAVTYLLGGSICLYGVEPSTQRIYKAVKWNGYGKPVGPKTAGSQETAYHEWAYAAWAVTSRLARSFGNVALAEKAEALGAPVRDGNYGNRDSYLAPAP